MKILVTGSEGSLMQSVIPVLIGQRHEIKGVDSFVRYGEIERARDYEFIRGDLTDAPFVDKIMKGVDGVIQAAALIYGVGGFNKYPADILLNDVTLHQNMLWSMLKYNVEKIAYISSSMVYEKCFKHPSKEEDAFNSLIPATDYGLSKLMGERMAISLSRQYGIKYVIWRPFNIITPYEKGEHEQGISHVFADFIKNIIIENKNPLPIFGSGDQIRCFTWIGDVASGVADHSFISTTDNEIYNLGNPKPISMKDLAKLIYKKAQDLNLIDSKKELEFITTKTFKDDVNIRIPNVEKASKHLNWTPKKDLSECIDLCLKEIRHIYS